MASTEQPAVLLIDDNEATCVLIQAILHHEFTCEQVLDGAEAMEKLKTKRYAAILLDLKMPHVDGFGVLAFLRDHFPERLGSVLIVTASLMPKELKEVEAFKVCGVIRKPFHVEELLDSVKKCIYGSEGRGTGGGFYQSSAVLLLLADLLRSRWG